MENNILSKFGQSLRSVRISKGMSQEQLADAINRDRTYISLLERGKRNPSLLCIADLCRELEISLSDLFSIIQSDEVGFKINDNLD